MNDIINKGKLSKIIAECYNIFGHEEVVKLLDKLKTLGFEEACRAGISIGIDDIQIPDAKEVILNEARKEVKSIEKEANNIVKSSTPVIKKFYPRTEAEKKFGMAIYQGGAVPGKRLRIVEIPGIDVQACGGTHLDNTSEAGTIKLIKSTKISDSIVRLEFTAGAAAHQEEKGERAILEESAKLLGCTVSQLPGRIEELFAKWKDAVKKKKQVDKTLRSTAEYRGDDVLKKISDTIKTQPEYVVKTIKRFLEEMGGLS